MFKLYYIDSTRALKGSKGASLQAALDWIEEHADDANIDDPIEESADDEVKEEVEQEEEGISGAQCLVCNDCGKKFTSVAFAQLHASKSGHEDFSESTEAIPVLTEEEKKERLAQLREKLAEKRKLDALKRQEEDKQNELIRRKATKDTAEIRRQLEEQERLKDLEKRNREKQEDKLQRERIKAQIEEDRRRMKEKAEEEKRRAQGIQQVHLDAQPIATEPSHIKSDIARLQIRLPDGSVLRETVSAKSTLNELLVIIEGKSKFSAVTHALMIALPPRQFDAGTEGGQSMEQLNLCPSATLILRKK